MKSKLLLLHGALGSKNQFNRLIKPLENDFDVYSFSFEGHDGSISKNEFSIQLFTDQVVSFLEANQLERIHIFGYSMGGYVALNTALHHPDRVIKILTLGTKFDWSEESAQAETKMLNPETILLKVPKYAQHLENEFGAANWKQVLIKTGNMMLDLGSQSKLTTKDLEQIDHNVLITVGSEDRMVCIEESKWAADALPNGTIQSIKDWPHPIDKIPIENLTKLIIESF